MTDLRGSWRAVGSSPARGARRIAAALTVLLLVVAPWSAGLATAAGRDDSADQLQHQASVARGSARVLQDRVSQALARYQGAVSGLAASVNASVTDERAASAAQDQAAAATAGQEARVRALYMTGGSLVFVDSLLQADSPGDLASRAMFASQVLDLGEVQATGASAAARRATQQAQVSQRTAQHQIHDLQQVEQAARGLQRLLDQARARAARLTDRAQRATAREQIAAARAAAAAATTAAARSVTAGGIPADFLQLYQAAAKTCPMPWVVLAAVGQVESGHGSNNGPSSSGALGPMQFLPSTFAAYAVDGDGNGTKDIWSPADSIYTAAHYLCSNGAGGSPHGLYAALFRYNHADWYVQLVMSVAAQLAQRFAVPVPEASAS